MKISFSTTGAWDNVDGFGCASLGLPGFCDNTKSAVRDYKYSLQGQLITGSYEEILSATGQVAGNDNIYAAIVVFGNAGGENTFLAEFRNILNCPVVGGGAAIDAASGHSGLIPGDGPAAVFLITDNRYTYAYETRCIHNQVLGECVVETDDPRTILKINGVDAAKFLADKKQELGISVSDFEHLTLSDLHNIIFQIHYNDHIKQWINSSIN